MGRPKSKLGYKGSRYNRLSHGVMIHDVLPSRGPDKCWYRESCPVIESERTRFHCRLGEPCPWESAFLEKYIDSARKTYVECLDWMTEAERDQVIRDLGILSLRRRRLSALVAREGFTRPKRHPVSGYEYGSELALGIGRYSTAISNKWEQLMTRLLGESDYQKQPGIAQTSSKPVEAPEAREVSPVAQH